MNILDNIEKIQKKDKNNLGDYVLSLPKHLIKAYNDLLDLDLPGEIKAAKNVIIGGMGGSGIAASIVNDVVEFKAPTVIINDCNLPIWTGEDSLVVLVSHSGFTEETLDLFEQAKHKTRNIFIISEKDNGRLENLARENGLPYYDYNASVPPRFALGEQMGALLGFFYKLELVKIDFELNKVVEEVEEFNKTLALDVETDDNQAKELAFEIVDRVPVIAASGVLSSVAYRWQTQANENSKNFAFHLVFPEAAHNAIEGIDWPKRSKDDLLVILLKNAFDNKHTRGKIELFGDLLDKQKMTSRIFDIQGDNKLSVALKGLLLGDWVSYYLALLNGVDIESIENIEWMKKIIKQEDNKTIKQK